MRLGMLCITPSARFKLSVKKVEMVDEREGEIRIMIALAPTLHWVGDATCFGVMVSLAVQGFLMFRNYEM